MIDWKRVKALTAELPEVVILASLDKSERGIDGGALVEADRHTAAVRITEGTHRLASEEEIRAAERRRGGSRT